MTDKRLDDVILINLADAGCDEETMRRFCTLEQEDSRDPLILNQQMHLLRKHRKALMTELHGCQSKIDCLDHLLYRLREEKQEKEESK